MLEFAKLRFGGGEEFGQTVAVDPLGGNRLIRHVRPLAVIQAVGTQQRAGDTVLALVFGQ